MIDFEEVLIFGVYLIPQKQAACADLPITGTGPMLLWKWAVCSSL